jgi:small conductance mechanosensitive channel
MEGILTSLRGVGGQVVDLVPGLVAAILIFIASLVVAKVAARAVCRASAKADAEVRRLLSRLITVTAVGVGAVVALDQVGVNVAGLVAGLGLLGFTVGFALQDIGKNLVAGILLLMQRPFEIGDIIEVAGYEGTVTNIDIRATSIKTYDGLQVIIPNADVHSNPITNYSAFPARRGQVAVTVGYEEDIPRAMEVLLGAVRAVEGVLDDPAPAVRGESLGNSGVELKAYFWIDQAESSILEVSSRAVMALNEAAARESLNLPYPIQTVRLRRISEAEPL